MIVSYAFYKCVKIKNADFSNCFRLNIIDQYSFSCCTLLSNIILPEGLSTIKQYAFSYTSISSIFIPASVKTLELCSFGQNNKLSHAEFAENSIITSLPINLFLNSPIVSFVIPPNVSYFKGGTFGGNIFMQSIKVNPNNKYFISENNAVYDINKKKICYYASAMTGHFSIPEGIQTIELGCFVSSKLSSLSLPSSVKTINDYAFSNSSMSEIKMTDSVTSIGRAAFYNMTDLKQINLSKGLTVISRELFMSSGLTSIVIPEGVTTIENGAFQNCPSLTNVSLPSSLTELGGAIFQGSIKANYTFPEDSNVYINSNMLLMDRANTIISQYYGSSNIVEIPFTVKTIKLNAFRNKINLQTLTCSSTSQLEVIEN